MELMPGYKQTEVGVIPNEWDCLLAREFGVFKGGSGFPLWAQGQRAGEFPFFKVSDMNNEGNETFMTAANHYISEQTRKHLGAQAFPAGSIVFAKVGAAVFLERKKILGQPSCIDNNMAAYVLDGSRADVRFVHSLLLMKKLGALVATTALPALNGKQLGEMVLALPALPEQRVIAQTLSDVDALLAMLDQVIAKKHDLKQAAMQQLLTGQIRLPGFNGEWEILPAREIGIFKGGCGFPLSAQGETEGEYPFFKVSDMNNEGNETFMTKANHYVSEQSRTRLGATAFPADSIVFAKVGAAVFLERKKILGQASCIDNNMAAFVLDKNRVDVGYIHALLLSRKLSALVTTTALPALNAKQLGEMLLPVPPLSEQSAIAAVLSDMDSELSELQARRDKTCNIKQAMMQELLTGKTRMV